MDRSRPNRHPNLRVWFKNNYHRCRCRHCHRHPHPHRHSQHHNHHNHPNHHHHHNYHHHLHHQHYPEWSGNFIGFFFLFLHPTVDVVQPAVCIPSDINRPTPGLSKTCLSTIFYTDVVQLDSVIFYNCCHRVHSPSRWSCIANGTYHYYLVSLSDKSYNL